MFAFQEKVAANQEAAEAAVEEATKEEKPKTNNFSWLFQQAGNINKKVNLFRHIFMLFTHSAI